MQQRNGAWGSTSSGEDATAAAVRAASAAIGDPAPPADNVGYEAYEETITVTEQVSGAYGGRGVFHPPWHRVVVKLSGEAFAGKEPLGISPDAVSHIAAEVVSAVKEGVEVAAVVGGGNMFRGQSLSERGIDRSRADYMGMLGTVIN